MYLAKLEINGFKSFPNRTQLSFEEGMMGVVGPNGCGKTNILDSIRWVLGEQRPTLLRSSKNDEVIFNGTSDLPPTDMAEVSLTVKNTRGLLPIEYDEVVITRRLYRSGESEYLINKKLCRLRDIHDLFADTGMSTHAYSVFHTGMIDAVLSENADERRFLFEEAAGITKYKTRKKDALKKLESTEADMLRLSDIISEISKNVRSLQRQAARARRFKTIRDDLRNLEARQAGAKIYDLALNIKEYQSDIISLRTQKEGLTAQTNKDESEVQKIKLEITGLDEGISQEASRTASLDSQVIRLENNLSNIQNALVSGKENVRTWTNEINALRGRIESLSSQKENALKQLSETSQELDGLNTTTIDVESNVLKLKGNIDQSQNSLDTIRQQLHRLENELTANSTRLEGIKSSLESLTTANNDIDSSRLALQAKKENSEKSLNEQKSRVKETETAIFDIDARLTSNQQTQIQFLAEMEEIKKAISTFNADNSAAKARHELLSQMIAHHEGYGSGIKAVFGWQAKPDGVIDTLANLLTADKRHHLAVESAINKYGQLVVCRTYDDASVCIEYLKANAAGRAGFLILDRAINLTQISNNNKCDGFIAGVAELVKCEEYLRPAVDAIFGDMAVFEPGKIPVSYDGEAVDLNGQYHGRLGTLEGGYTTVSLVGRRSELSDLQDLLTNLASKIEQTQIQLGQKELELTKLNASSGQLTDKRKTLLAIREKLIADLGRVEFDFKQSASRLDQLSLDSQQSAKRAQELYNQRADIEKIVVETTQTLTKLQEQFDLASKDHKALSASYENQVTSLNQKRLRLVELTGLKRKLDDDIKRFGEIIDEALQMISQKTSMSEAEQTKWQEYEKQQANLKDELKQLFATRDSVETDKGKLLGQRNGLTQQLDKYETELRKLRAEINGTSEQIHQAELHLTEYQAQVKSIEDSLYHETGVKITATKPDDYDEATAIAEIERHKRIVDKLGPVNMLADDEYQTEKDRLDFLEAQMKDLNDAKSSLKEAIGKINITAEEKFNTTFAQIKENFQTVFQTLFEGGTAEVSLLNPNDVLESPIEIMARPGSKKVSSIGQLSGGERALTAISLLFSIYMVKPSPFCILDEIDAPLDDANVTRFLRLLDKFTESTQFIVITHNKKTMEAANILYGVTMDKPGVSSIVSVKFNDNVKAEAGV